MPRIGVGPCCPRKRAAVQGFSSQPPVQASSNQGPARQASRRQFVREVPTGIVSQARAVHGVVCQGMSEVLRRVDPQGRLIMLTAPRRP
jgi:hypothetical protein